MSELLMFIGALSFYLTFSGRQMRNTENKRVNKLKRRKSQVCYIKHLYAATIYEMAKKSYIHTNHDDINSLNEVLKRKQYLRSTTTITSEWEG